MLNVFLNFFQLLYHLTFGGYVLENQVANFAFVSNSSIVRDVFLPNWF